MNIQGWFPLGLTSPVPYSSRFRLPPPPGDLLVVPADRLTSPSPVWSLEAVSDSGLVSQRLGFLWPQWLVGEWIKWMSEWMKWMNEYHHQSWWIYIKSDICWVFWVEKGPSSSSAEYIWLMYETHEMCTEVSKGERQKKPWHSNFT